MIDVFADRTIVIMTPHRYLRKVYAAVATREITDNPKRADVFS